MRFDLDQETFKKFKARIKRRAVLAKKYKKGIGIIYREFAQEMADANWSTFNDQLASKNYDAVYDIYTQIWLEITSEDSYQEALEEARNKDTKKTWRHFQEIARGLMILFLQLYSAIHFPKKRKFTSFLHINRDIDPTTNAVYIKAGAFMFHWLDQVQRQWREPIEENEITL